MHTHDTHTHDSHTARTSRAVVAVTVSEFATCGTYRNGVPHVWYLTDSGTRALAPCTIIHTEK